MKLWWCLKFRTRPACTRKREESATLQNVRGSFIRPQGRKKKNETNKDVSASSHKDVAQEKGI